jgi:hypothetical protein
MVDTDVDYLKRKGQFFFFGFMVKNWGRMIHCLPSYFVSSETATRLMRLEVHIVSFHGSKVKNETLSCTSICGLHNYYRRGNWDNLWILKTILQCKANMQTKNLLLL